MADEAGREEHLKTGQRDAAVLDGIQFSDGELGECQKERTGEVGPQRVAVEVRALQRIPWRGQDVPGERLLRMVSFGDDAAVEFLDGDPVRSEVGLLIVGAEGPHR
jgi:hypothetical protein